MKYDEDYLSLCVQYLDDDEPIPLDIIFKCVSMGIDVNELEHNHSIRKDLWQTESTQ